MHVNFDVFGPIMLNWIVSKIDYNFLSQYKVIGPWELNPNSLRGLESKESHKSYFPMTQNSASTLDIAITSCLLLRYVTKVPPTNVQYHDVDLLSSIEQAQSASVKVSVRRSFCLTYKSPWSELEEVLNILLYYL